MQNIQQLQLGKQLDGEIKYGCGHVGDGMSAQGYVQAGIVMFIPSLLKDSTVWYIFKFPSLQFLFKFYFRAQSSNRWGDKHSGSRGQVCWIPQEKWKQHTAGKWRGSCFLGSLFEDLNQLCSLLCLCPAYVGDRDQRHQTSKQYQKRRLMAIMFNKITIKNVKPLFDCLKVCKFDWSHNLLWL